MYLLNTVLIIIQNIILLLYSIWTAIYHWTRKNYFDSLAEYLLEIFIKVLYPMLIILVSTYSRMEKDNSNNDFMNLTIERSVIEDKLKTILIFLVTVSSIGFEMGVYMAVYGLKGSKYYFAVWYSEVCILYYFFTMCKRVHSVNLLLNQFTQQVRFLLTETPNRIIYNRIVTMTNKILAMHNFVTERLIVLGKIHGITFLSFLIFCILQMSRGLFYSVAMVMQSEIEIVSYGIKTLLYVVMHS